MRTILATDRRVLALAFARMADAIGNSFLIVVLPAYIASGAVSGDTFGLSVTLVTGIVLSLFGFANSFMQPFAGRYSDRTGRRKVFILFGLGVLAVSSLSYVVATNYASLLVIRAVQGVGVAFTIPCTIALVNELATEENRGGNMGVFNTFRLLGFGTGPVVAGALVHRGPYAVPGVGTLSGFDAAFSLAAGLAAVSYAMVWLLVSDPEETKAHAGEDLSIAVLDADGDGLDPVFTIGLASLFMAIAIALFATLEQTINARLDQSATWFGLQFGAFVLAQVGLQTPIGRASDRYGRRPFLVVGMVLLVPATLVQGFVASSMAMLAARLTQGVAGALMFSPSMALAGDLAGEGESGTKLSVITMSFGLGTAIGPLSSGYLVQFGFAVPFVFGTALAALGAVLVYTQVQETLPSVARDPVVSPQD